MSSHNRSRHESDLLHQQQPRVSHAMYMDNESYCESCSACNRSASEDESSSSSSSSATSFIAQDTAAGYATGSGKGCGSNHQRVKYMASHPAYPKQHSFVVDMANRPLYEVEKKPKSPSPTKRRPRSTSRTRSSSPPPASSTGGGAGGGNCSLAHLPPGIDKSGAYYPPKSPFAKEEKKRNLSGACSKRMILLYIVLFCIALALYFSLLGQVVEIHGAVERIEAMVEEIKNKTS